MQLTERNKKLYFLTYHVLVLVFNITNLYVNKYSVTLASHFTLSKLNFFNAYTKCGQVLSICVQDIIT